MSLTIDQLLAQESSSEDDDIGESSSVACRNGDVAVNPGAGVGVGDRDCPPPPLASAQIKVDDRQIQPSAATTTVMPSSRPALTVEEALAQGDLSDDDDDERISTVEKPSVEEALMSGVERGAYTGDDCLSDWSQDEQDCGVAHMASLDEVLAMNSDSSDEDGAFGGGGIPTAESAEKMIPNSGEASKRGGADDSEAALVDADEDATGLEAFCKSPFEWCLEHERSLLSGASVGGGAGANEVALGDIDASLGAGASVVAPFPIIETQPCAEKRRLLAQECGLPTCVTASSKLVAVGSIRGVVVLWDPKAAQDTEIQPQILHPPGNEEAVAVTAAAISPDGSSLLVGHKNGQLVLWDLTTGKPASVMKDTHSCAVLSVAFTRSSWQTALSADAGGTVFILTFSSTFGRRDCKHQLLLDRSSSVGTTLRVLPLPPVPPPINHPADSHCLVALCATRATVLLTLHPQAQLLQKMQYRGKEAPSKGDAWVPDAVWLRLETREWVDGTQQAAADPRLCVVFGQTVHIMRVGFTKEKSQMKEEFKICLEHRYVWGATIQNVSAFNESVLAVFDSTNTLSVVQLPAASEEDVENGGKEAQKHRQHLTAVHSEDVSSWSTVYHSHGLEDGARSHHSAFAVFRGRSRALYAVGMREIWSLQIRRWGKQVEELVNKNSWPAALGVFLALSRGSLPPLLDYPHALGPRRRAIESRTTQVIQSYLSSRLQQDTSRPRARQMCHTALGACVEMGLWSVLYKTVFECFKAAGHMSVYCNTLEPFIVKGRIPRGQMDSEVLSSILQSYSLPLEEEEQTALQHIRSTERNGGSTSTIRSAEATVVSMPFCVDCDHYPLLFPVARRIQQLILYVDVSQLDLNMSIRLFTQHRLWTALLRVYCALGDFASPLELLLGECLQLAKRSHQPNPADATRIPTEEAPLLQCRLTRKLYFFLRRCFELRGFPFDAEADKSRAVAPGAKGIAELLTCIFRLQPGVTGKSLPPPTFLRLLRLSPFGFFGALSVLYTSPAAREALCSLEQSPNTGKASGDMAGPSPLSLSGLLDAAHVAMDAAKRQCLEDKTELPANTDFEFLWFVARAVPEAKVALPSPQLERVVEQLLAAADLQDVQSGRASAKRPNTPLLGSGARSPAEAERCLLAVLEVQDPLDESKRLGLIAKAMHRGFFKSASWLHECHGEYDQALDCRFRDDALSSGVFEYIILRLAAEEQAGANSQAAALVEATMQRLPKLVAIDAEQCAEMICEHFASSADHDGVLDRLRHRGYPQIELKYLETLLVKCRRNHWRHPEEQREFFDSHVVRYIELLCSISPAAVLPFLQDNEALPLRECLELCRAHSVTDASVYLLERTGDFGAVLDLMLSGYSKALEQLHACFLEPRTEDRQVVTKALRRLTGTNLKVDAAKVDGAWWDGFGDAQRCVDLINDASELSSRNSNLMTADQLEELWFGVLARTVQWQEKAAVNKESSKRFAGITAAFADLSSQVMIGVLAYLSLPRALKWICETFGASSLGIWKESLQQMLSGLAFQQGLLQAAKAVAARDVVRPFMAVKMRGVRGVLVSPETPASTASTTSSGALRIRLGARSTDKLH
eukprot:TRINITY_DN6510_c0_g1_i1.p1 TRINITY_DN6510_c0_g1~~TRINITY_DN6510_c0_g1_i1.p1  ORF type:complete len:1590 (-),score=304.28 TRINITY_DN6510_c0_g1_i1:110-4879(-)